MALVFDQEDIVQLVGFHMGSKLFGASILTVREILRAPSVEAMSGAPALVNGITRLRGAVIPVVSLGNILGVPENRGTHDKPWMLIGLAGRRRVGFIVDGVTPIVRIQTDAIQPPPEMLLSGLRTKYIRGVCETAKGMLVIVELDRIFREEEIKALESISAR